MQRLFALAFALLAACSASASPMFYCRETNACIEYRDGFADGDRAALQQNCVGDPGYEAFGDGACPPVGGFGSCEITSGTQSIVTHYYAGFGDGTARYAHMTCDAGGGVWSDP